MNDATRATGLKLGTAILLMILGVITMLVTGVCTVAFMASDMSGFMAFLMIGGLPFLSGLALYAWGNWLRKRP